MCQNNIIHDLKLKIISHTKKIAQCQVIVDVPLLYGTAFFKRTKEKFMKLTGTTSTYAWLESFINKRYAVKQFENRVMRYFISPKAYQLLRSDKKSEAERIPTEYQNCRVYQQLYTMHDYIKSRKIQELIQLFKYNQAGVSEYKTMILRYLKKAKEAGAVIIIFPELSFTNLNMEENREFMELARDCMIIGGGIQEVPQDERGEVLENTQNTLNERVKIKINFPDPEIIDIIELYKNWLHQYEAYQKAVLSGMKQKALFYNVTYIFKDGILRTAIKNTNTAREIRWNILPGSSYSIVNSRLFNIIQVNCEDFIIREEEYSGHNDEIIKIINYTEGKKNGLEWQENIFMDYLNSGKKPITTTVVISYKENPEEKFKDAFQKLFKKTDILLALYTNSGTMDEKIPFGKTGLYCRTITIEDITCFDSLDANNIDKTFDGYIYKLPGEEPLLKISPMGGNDEQTDYRICFSDNCHYGILVSSYVDDPRHPYLKDIEMYLPEDGEHGELTKVL